jgi:ribonuclease VapC
MVIDTSALLAIIFDETESEAIAQAIEDDPVRLISAGTYLECSIVLMSRSREAGAEALDEFVASAGCDVVPVTRRQAQVARSAFRQFGKGNHPARLNFGDCFAYALARTSEEPLLYKGKDFSRTDIAAVPWP